MRAGVRMQKEEKDNGMEAEEEANGMECHVMNVIRQ
jgi:hypothetical protein